MNAKKKIPLYDINLSDAAKSNVNSVLDSGWLSPGKYSKKFEEKICALTNCKHGVVCSSATDSLQLALFALGIGAGDEVITTPFTFVATIEAILAVGATPVFADIQKDSLHIDPVSVETKLTPATKAIITVDIGGEACDYQTLKKICTGHKIALIADSAHAIGTTYKKKYITHYADAVVVSFHTTKNLICGEGGIVLSRHKSMTDSIRLISRHGMTKTASDRKKSNSWEYDIVSPGIKANMSEVHAAIGLGQLTVFKKEQSQRKKIAERYLKNLSMLKEFISLPSKESSNEHGWHLFIIQLNHEKINLSRDDFIREMAKKGIECGVHYKPLFEMTYYKKAMQLKSENFPNAKLAGQSVVTLPLYPILNLSDIDYISDSIKKILL
ncbi:MAG: DegT/DnrJ/EryC1/StrS aminotransferase family protein [Calditrichaeota bacterium]|nr:MAG: DegT/DnrJ/EryC1/StrS aminotransferase family protein [Calditrichota bacterium]